MATKRQKVNTVKSLLNGIDTEPKTWLVYFKEVEDKTTGKLVEVYDKANFEGYPKDVKKNHYKPPKATEITLNID